MKKEIVIAADHGGYELKQKLISWLKKEKFKVNDFGTDSPERVDYPEYAARVGLAIASGAYSQGILICSSGVGMSIGANRYPGVRASLCYNEKIAKHTREHNQSNVLCLGAQYLKEEEAIKILKAWLETKPTKEKRYQERTAMLDEMGLPSCSGCC